MAKAKSLINDPLNSFSVVKAPLPKPFPAFLKNEFNQKLWGVSLSFTFKFKLEALEFIKDVEIVEEFDEDGFNMC